MNQPYLGLGATFCTNILSLAETLGQSRIRIRIRVRSTEYEREGFADPVLHQPCQARRIRKKWGQFSRPRYTVIGQVSSAKPCRERGSVARWSPDLRTEANHFAHSAQTGCLWEHVPWIWVELLFKVQRFGLRRLIKWYTIYVNW